MVTCYIIYTIVSYSNPCLAPNTSPYVTSISAITPTSFALEWDPPNPEDQNGIIRLYQLRVVELETGNMFNVTSNETSLSLKDLHPAYTYQCSIAALTVAFGPPSESFNVTTDEDGK